MGEPERLFAPPAATGHLTERQQTLYNELADITRQGSGLGADEAGAILCERNGKHDRGERCDWDARNGRQALVSLRKKGLAKQSRARGWIALQVPEDDHSDVDPFPEGF